MEYIPNIDEQPDDDENASEIQEDFDDIETDNDDIESIENIDIEDDLKNDPSGFQVKLLSTIYTMTEKLKDIPFQELGYGYYLESRFRKLISIDMKQVYIQKHLELSQSEREFTGKGLFHDYIKRIVSLSEKNYFAQQKLLNALMQDKNITNIMNSVKGQMTKVFRMKTNENVNHSSYKTFDDAYYEALQHYNKSQSQLIDHFNPEIWSKIFHWIASRIYIGIFKYYLTDTPTENAKYNQYKIFEYIKYWYIEETQLGDIKHIHFDADLFEKFKKKKNLK